MPSLTVTDGTRIAYRDIGSGQPILFSHGWPLASDAWEAQLLFFGHNGFRVVAHDRRGHGSSDHTWHGNSIDQYADDLAELVESLDLRDLVLVGHSTGGGEVARYIGRHGTARVARVVMVGAVPPLMLRTDDNPQGTPLEVFDDIRKGTALDRSRFFKQLATPFYGFNRDGVEENEGSCATASGSWACAGTSRATMTASTSSRRWTTARTSGRSTARRSSSTETTTRSCRSPRPPREP